MIPPSAASRYHALDALRAAMMFLGIYLHAAVAYSPKGGWPFKPPEVTTALDYTITWIHVFRMPVFYVMAGFFAALLLDRYGLRRAAGNRFWRIVIPFVVGCIVLVPVMSFLIALGRAGLPRATEFILSGRFLAYAHPGHLWFLEYLIVLYGLALIVVAIVPRKVWTRLSGPFRAVLRSVWAPLPLVAVSFFAMLPMKWPWLEDPPGFVPEPRIVVAYAIPFALGWLLYANADLLDVLKRRAWLYAVVAGLASLCYIALLYSTGDRGWGFYANRLAHALAMWSLIFAVTGLFLRYLSGHSPLRRYLCDSSYFLYIAHLPLIVALEILLLDVPLPPLVKVALVLVATIALLLPVYHYGVRPTAIGAVLNGRRYPITPAARIRPAIQARSSS
jgi:peptidoglycan/LPS O-acetylase OafA/YrhL